MRRLLAGTTALLALPAMAQEADLLIMDYAGFEDPRYHAAYAEAFGGSPDYSFFGDEEEAFQKLRTGFQADMAHICSDSVPKWTEAGLIEPWDTGAVAAFGDLNTDLIGAQAGEGDVFYLPADFGSTAVAYNTEEVPAEDVATLEVFKDPDYAGRVTMPDNVADAYALAYLATGVTDWTQATDEQFEAATAWLREVHPNIRTYWSDPAELAQLMVSGEVLISWAWNETYPTLADEDFPIGFQREAAEGSSLWVCGWVNLADGPGSEEQLYDFLNAYYAEETTGPLLEDGFGHANASSMAAVSADELEAAGLGEIDAPVLAQLPQPAELRERQIEAFEMIKAGF
ncbi:MAG: extracellular solute-binding protein [Hasllibacter sp.]